MANLEEKFLNGDVVGYCSSSDEEDKTPWNVARDADDHQRNVMQKISGGSSNTGAKGVLADFHDFRNRVKLEREAHDRAIAKQAIKGNMQGTKEEREQAQVYSEEDEDSLESLRARRLKEIRKALSGKVAECTERTQFIQTIDRCKEVLLGVLIYEPGIEECEKITHVIKVLASDYPNVKFIRARSTLLEMSKKFTEQALPTLQFYFNGNLIGNFVQMSILLGQDYDGNKLKMFLKKNHINLAKNCYSIQSEDSTDYDD